MPKMTLKRLGDRIRKDLKQAQQNGTLPGEVGEYGSVRYDVRVTNTAASGPMVNVTVTGIEPLLPCYPNPTNEGTQEWLDTDGAALLAAVDRIRGAYNPPQPVYGGVAKFGDIFISASVATVREVL